MVAAAYELPFVTTFSESGKVGKHLLSFPDAVTRGCSTLRLSPSGTTSPGSASGLMGVAAIPRALHIE
jgi:hypothetical protein